MSARPLWLLGVGAAVGAALASLGLARGPRPAPPMPADAVAVVNGARRSPVRPTPRRWPRHPKARVMFLEKIPKDTIYAAYQSADVFLLGARHETQPLAILDAMAAGVPFISTNAGCVSEFPGGLIRKCGPETTKAIQEVLNNDDLRQILGAEGRAACETKYDWERVLDAYEKLFKMLVAKKP